VKLSAYQKMTAVEKRTRSIGAQREPAITCPSCDVQLMTEDLLKHMDERCKGLREPGGAAKWVSWAEVARLEVSAGTLHYWVQQGRVRRRGERIDYRYLLRDIVLILAVRRLRQRRDIEGSKSDELESQGTK
jgi:hypothetical protein